MVQLNLFMVYYHINEHLENEENENKNDNNGYLQLHIEFGICLMNSIEAYKNGLKRFKNTCFILNRC